MANIQKKTGWTTTQFNSISWTAYDAAFCNKSLIQQISIANIGGMVDQSLRCPTSLGWGHMLRGHISSLRGDAYVKELKSSKPRELH